MSDPNPNGRLEAFSDGVFSIAITLLVIELAVPAPETIRSTGDLWTALGRMTPAVFSFVLSFLVILITWFNHSAILKLLDKSTPAFVYANGLLLLTVAVVPFPTALLGAFIRTDHAAPAVVIYNAVIALQAATWVLVTEAALRGTLTRNEAATRSVREACRHGYLGFALYTMLALAAFWLPTLVAAITTATWVFWLIHGITIRREHG